MRNNDNITQLAKRKLIFASVTADVVQTTGQYDRCKIEQRARELLFDILNTRSIFINLMCQLSVTVIEFQQTLYFMSMQQTKSMQRWIISH